MKLIVSPDKCTYLSFTVESISALVDNMSFSIKDDVELIIDVISLEILLSADNLFDISTDNSLSSYADTADILSERSFLTLLNKVKDGIGLSVETSTSVKDEAIFLSFKKYILVLSDFVFHITTYFSQNCLA